MQYWRARQHVDGGFHYCCGSTPVGYCADHPPHATKEEAQECYRQYMIDHMTRRCKSESSKHRCEECGEWTQHYVTVGYCEMIWLCEHHDVAPHIQRPSEMWTS